jgi:hypothetical protein
LIPFPATKDVNSLTLIHLYAQLIRKTRRKVAKTITLLYFRALEKRQYITPPESGKLILLVLHFFLSPTWPVNSRNHIVIKSMRWKHLVNGELRIFFHTRVRLFKKKCVIYLGNMLTGARRLADDQTVFSL